MCLTLEKKKNRQLPGLLSQFSNICIKTAINVDLYLYLNLVTRFTTVGGFFFSTATYRFGWSHASQSKLYCVWFRQFLTLIWEKKTTKYICIYIRDFGVYERFTAYCMLNLLYSMTEQIELILNRSSRGDFDTIILYSNNVAILHRDLKLMVLWFMF